MDASSPPPQHTAVVRVTHWITAVCFLALVVTGVEIVISHPRFYWGETGNVNTPSLFDIPIPASRSAVKTGYNYVLPDQNGWSRALHFQTAWLVAFTGLAYLIHGLRKSHFRARLLSATSDYNTAQRITYLIVIFGLFPLIIWTGLAMSPAFTAAFPFTVNSLGGQQSARTIHFFVFLALFVFLLGHVAMVIRAGFRSYVTAMITGHGRNDGAAK